MLRWGIVARAITKFVLVDLWMLLQGQVSLSSCIQMRSLDSMHCLRLSCITQISTQQLKPPCWNCTTSHSGILCETALSAWGRTRMRGTTAANSVFGEARHRPHLLRQPQLALPLCGGQLRQRVQRVAVSTPQGKQISRCRGEWLRHLAAQGPVREQGVNREVHLRLQRSRHRRGLMTGATNQHRLTRPARTPTWQPWTEKQYAWVPCSAPVGGAPSSTRVPPIGPSVENNMENAKAKQAAPPVTPGVPTIGPTAETTAGMLPALAKTKATSLSSMPPTGLHCCHSRQLLQGAQVGCRQPAPAGASTTPARPSLLPWTPFNPHGVPAKAAAVPVIQSVRPTSDPDSPEPQ